MSLVNLRDESGQRCRRIGEMSATVTESPPGRFKMDLGGKIES
jgi:hypothetical protein